jgi:hypothetical protein
LCVPDTAANYALLTEGCELGRVNGEPVTLKNVDWGSSAPTPDEPNRVQVDPNDVLITPFFGAGSLSISFSSVEGKDVFNVSGDQSILAFLDYFVDPPPPIYDEFDLSIEARTPTGAGTAAVEARICAGDVFTNNCASGFDHTLLAVVTATTNTPDRIDFPRIVNQIDVRMAIELQANGDTSQIDGAGQTVGFTPEPGSVITAVSGLLALLLLKRRRR